MKKKVIIITVILLTFSLSFTGYYIYTGIQNRNKCEATYIKHENGYLEGISYNGRNYYDFCSMAEEGIYGEHVSAEFDDYPAPYKLVMAEDNETYSKKVYIKQDKFSDYTLNFDKYFFYYSETYDKNRNFIVKNNRYDFNEIYVDENFVFPTIENNEVEAVWMSASASDEDHITDKETVDKIVKCIKSNGEIELDKVIVGYIKKRSWDYHCFCVKYKDYPIIEQFHISKTEEGKYIIKQFTPEEYNTVYYDDELHYKH